MTDWGHLGGFDPAVWKTIPVPPCSTRLNALCLQMNSMCDMTWPRRHGLFGEICRAFCFPWWSVKSETGGLKLPFVCLVVPTFYCSNSIRFPADSLRCLCARVVGGYFVSQDGVFCIILDCYLILVSYFYIILYYIILYYIILYHWFGMVWTIWFLLECEVQWLFRSPGDVSEAWTGRRVKSSGVTGCFPFLRLCELEDQQKGSVPLVLLDFASIIELQKAKKQKDGVLKTIERHNSECIYSTLCTVFLGQDRARFKSSKEIHQPGSLRGSKECP